MRREPKKVVGDLLEACDQAAEIVLRGMIAMTLTRYTVWLQRPYWDGLGMRRGN